jgi:hypothetical protein
MQKETLKLIFSNPPYLALSTVIFVGLLLSLSIVSEFIFTDPYLTLYVPSYSILSFSLIVLVSALSGLVVSMSIYRVRLIRTSAKNAGSSIAGSVIGGCAGACSCGSIGFAVVSTFGAVGGTATAFLTNYEIPLRLVSIGILAYTYYITMKGLTAECKVRR